MKIGRRRLSQLWTHVHEFGFELRVLGFSGFALFENFPFSQPHVTVLKSSWRCNKRSSTWLQTTAGRLRSSLF